MKRQLWGDWMDGWMDGAEELGIAPKVKEPDL